MFAALSVSADPVNRPVIRLVADEWAPYNMTPASGKEGYIVDLAREIFAAHGIDVDYQIVPWARAVRDTRAGIYDGVIGASVSDAPGFVFPAEPLAVNRLAFVTRSDSTWSYRDHSSVSAVSLGVISGYDYRAWLTTYIAANRKNPQRIQEMFGEAPLEANFRKLMSGKVGALVDSETALKYTAASLGLTGQIRLAGNDTEPAIIHVAFSPARLRDSERLAELLADGIRSLRASGRLKVILDRYGLQDWQTN